MRRPLLIAALVGTSLAPPALADVTVRYKAAAPANAAEGSAPQMPGLTVAADDGGQGRIEMTAPGTGPGPRPSVALITRENVGYVAFNGPGSGMSMVARTDDALALLGQFAAPLMQGSIRDSAQQAMQQRVEIHPVGPETVAGVRGNLYRVVVVTGETRSPPFEIVVATDPRLAPVGREFARLFASARPTVVSLLGGEPQVYMAARGLMELGAPLRLGSQVQIDTISTDDVPDSQFALPGPVMSREQLQQMAGMMMGMMRQGQGPRPPGAPTPAPTTPQ